MIKDIERKKSDNRGYNLKLSKIFVEVWFTTSKAIKTLFNIALQAAEQLEISNLSKLGNIRKISKMG